MDERHNETRGMRETCKIGIFIPLLQPLHTKNEAQEIRECLGQANLMKYLDTRNYRPLGMSVAWELVHLMTGLDGFVLRETIPDGELSF